MRRDLWHKFNAARWTQPTTLVDEFATEQPAVARSRSSLLKWPCRWQPSLQETIGRSRETPRIATSRSTSKIAANHPKSWPDKDHAASPVRCACDHAAVRESGGGTRHDLGFQRQSHRLQRPGHDELSRRHGDQQCRLLRFGARLGSADAVWRSLGRDAISVDDAEPGAGRESQQRWGDRQRLHDGLGSLSAGPQLE